MEGEKKEKGFVEEEKKEKGFVEGEKTFPIIFLKAPKNHESHPNVAYYDLFGHPLRTNSDS